MQRVPSKTLLAGFASTSHPALRAVNHPCRALRRATLITRKPQPVARSGILALLSAQSLANRWRLKYQWTNRAKNLLHFIELGVLCSLVYVQTKQLYKWRFVM